MFAYGHRGKCTLGRLGERGTLSALTGYHKCPVPTSPKFLRMDSGANGHLKEGVTLSGLKGYSKCPVPIHQKLLQMGRGENWHLRFLEVENFWGKGYPKCVLIVPISPKWTEQNGQWGKWALPQMPIFSTAHLKKIGENGHRTLGVLLPKMSICKHLGVG